MLCRIPRPLVREQPIFGVGKNSRGGRAGTLRAEAGTWAKGGRRSRAGTARRGVCSPSGPGRQTQEPVLRGLLSGDAQFFVPQKIPAGGPAGGQVETPWRGHVGEAAHGSRAPWLGWELGSHWLVGGSEGQCWPETIALAQRVWALSPNWVLYPGTCTGVAVAGPVRRPHWAACGPCASTLHASAPVA